MTPTKLLIMAVSRTLFSSDKIDWESPQPIFEGLDAEFGFDLDVCATAANAKCKKYFTPEEDAFRKTGESTFAG